MQPLIIRQKGKEVCFLFNPCIAIDVSKGSSHIQGFYNSQDQVSKPTKINHTITDFNQIKILYDLLVSKTNKKPLIIFEYTGVYHKTLVSYLEMNKYDYQPVSPLKSAKMRQKDLRSAKTDKRDCLNLANMYYQNELGIFSHKNKIYQDLKVLNLEYSTNKIHLQKLEVTLNELLDTIYPNFEEMFSNFLATNTLKFLSKFPHPEILINSSLEDIIKFFTEDAKHTLKYSTKKTTKIFSYTRNIISGCSKDSHLVNFLLDTIRQLDLLTTIQNEIEDKLIQLAKQTPNFNVIRSFPGVGDNLTARLIAELGNISRFKKPEQINAFFGIDPIVLQSGKMSGEHLSMSKKGNKRLRSIGFLIVRSMIRKKVKDNSIKAFYYKKKTQPNVPPKVALFACLNKLIRIIHSLCKSGEVYNPSQH